MTDINFLTSHAEHSRLASKNFLHEAQTEQVVDVTQHLVAERGG